LVTRAEPAALRARAVGVVEREHARRNLRQGDAALGAREALGEEHRLAALAAVGHGLDLDHAVGQAQRGLERVGEPRAEAVTHDETVDDHLDRVLALFVELDLLAELADGAVHPDAREPLALEVEEQLLVFALAPAGSSKSSSARSRSRATAPRSSPPRASPSARGTGAHRPRATRRSGAGPRHRSCRRPATIFRTLRAP